MDKVQETFNGIKADTLDLIEQIKGGQLPNDRQVRFLNFLVFVLLVFPSIYRYFVIGSQGESDLARSTIDFLRLAGVFSFGLFVVASIARRHTDQSIVTTLQKDIFRLFTYVFSLLAVTAIYNYFQGGTVFYTLWGLFYIAFAFFNAKSAKFF